MGLGWPVAGAGSREGLGRQNERNPFILGRGLAAGAPIGPPGKTKGSLHGTIKNDTFWGCSPWERHLDTPELKLLEVFFNSPSVRVV